MPAIHLEDDAGICLRQRIQKLDRHVDLGAVFRTATARTIAQGKITRTDIGAKYLITGYLFALQMGIAPTRCFHGPRGLGGRLLLLNGRIVYAQANGCTLRLCQFIFFDTQKGPAAPYTAGPFPIQSPKLMPSSFASFTMEESGSTIFSFPATSSRGTFTISRFL